MKKNRNVYYALFLALLVVAVVVGCVAPDVDTDQLKQKYLDRGLLIEESPYLGTPEYYEGMYLYQVATINGTSCGHPDCHNMLASGEPNDIRLGTSMLNNISQQYDTTWVTDRPTVRRRIVNSGMYPNTLNGGQLGFEGFNTEYRDSVINFLGLKGVQIASNEHQFLVATSKGAHDMGDLHISANKNNLAKKLCFNTNQETEVTIEGAHDRIVKYQDAYRSTQANVQLWMRGETELKHPYGAERFLAKCQPCHTDKAFGGFSLHDKLVDSEYKGHYSDPNKIRPSGLYNLPHVKGFGHTGNQSYDDIMGLHAEKIDSFSLTWLEEIEIRNFLFNDCHDEDMGRHVRVPQEIIDKIREIKI